MHQPDRDSQFDEVMRRSQASVRAYIAGMGIAPHEVDDVAQEVFIEYYKGMEKVPPDVVPERWLKGIARNLCLNHIRRCARRGRLHREALAELLARLPAQYKEPTSPRSMQYALGGCYENLPDRSRRLLRLRYQEEMSSASIAERVDSTSQAIRVALHRIRLALRDCIDRKLAQET